MKYEIVGVEHAVGDFTPTTGKNANTVQHFDVYTWWIWSSRITETANSKSWGTFCKMLCFDLLVKETVHSGRAAEENRVIALQGILFDKIRRDKVKLKAGFSSSRSTWITVTLLLKKKTEVVMPFMDLPPVFSFWKSVQQPRPCR